MVVSEDIDMTSPTPIFGSANISVAYLTQDSVEGLLNVLKKVGITRIDTAARCPATDPGQSEKLLGDSKAATRFTIDTKIKVITPSGEGTLSARAIEQSIRESFARLGVEKVCREFLRKFCRKLTEARFSYTADPETPLLEQAIALDSHHKKGEFKFVRPLFVQSASIS
jgi:aflatoxin B1 aldehyde reductase